MLGLLDAFRSDRRGSVAMLFGVLLVVIMAAMGLVIDYSIAIWRRAKLQAAADSAVLAVVNSISRTPGNEQDIAAAIERGKRIFIANLQDADAGITPIVSVQNNAGLFEAQIRLAGSSKMYFGKFFRRGQLDLPIVANAKVGGTGHLDVYLALDVSASMGLGAAVGDQQQLKNLTGCQFACHVDDGSGSVLDIAIANNIPLRLDVLKNDATDLVTSMQNSPAASFFRVGVTAFHDRATELLAPTNDFAAANSAIGGLRLALGQQRTRPEQENGATPDAGDSQPQSLVDMLEANISGQGIGSAADPKKFVVIVTDGTRSTYSPGLETRAWDPATCNELKSRGIDIAVIYLEYTYLDKDTDATWPWAIAPIEAQIEPNLKACSSDLFLKANDPAEVRSAFEAVFDKLVQTTGVVLTQ